MTDKKNDSEKNSRNTHPEWDHDGDLHEQTGSESLGIAGGLAKSFIHSSLTPLLLMVCFAVGIMGVILTPRQEDPQISVPMVDIFVSYQGASANQVSKLAIEPLERILDEIRGVDHVYSASMHDQGIVTVQFEVGEELETSLVKVYDKIASNQDLIPPGVREPLVKPKGVDDVPTVTFTLWSNTVDDSILRLVALDVLQATSSVENSSQGFVVGGRSDQINIEVQPEKLSGFEITLDQLANTIHTANSELGLGEIESNDHSFKVYTGAFLKTASDVQDLVVSINNGSPVYVRDVAKVTEGPADTKNLVSYYTSPINSAEGSEVAYSAPAVTIAIAKKKGSNGVQVSKDLLAKIESLKGTVIPEGINVEVTRDYGKTADNKVTALIIKLFIATGIVVVLIWIALSFRWEPALVVMIVIPVVILVTVFYALVQGYTIDRVSLFALIFSIGILVDDAIVVVENIYRRWIMDDSTSTDVAVDAVREVGNPTILATFTVIAALLPMGFVRGMMGPYMEPIPALGSFAMLFSVIAAFVFTPWLAMRIKPSMKMLAAMEEKEHGQNEWLGNLFNKLLIPLITSKLKGMLFLISMFVVFFLSVSLFYTKAVPVKMLPLDNKPEFNIVVNLNEGRALPLTANIVNEIADIVLEVDEVTAVQTYVGTASPFNFNGLVRHYYLRSQPWEADVQVQLKGKTERERSSHAIAEDVRERLQKVLKGREDFLKLQVVEMPPGPPVLQSVVAEIYGNDADERRTVARDLEKMFQDSPNITDVDTLMSTEHEVWRFEVETEKAVRRGISVDTINRNLQMALGGYRLGDVKNGYKLEPTYIVLQIPLSIRSDLARLKELPIPSQMGGSVPLGELGDFHKQTQDPIIYHKDLRNVEYVTGETLGRLGAPIYGMFDVGDALEDYRTPGGHKLEGTWTAPPESDDHLAFEWAGEWTVTYETFRDMGMAFGIAIILIYMLVVMEFGNFSLPAIIMAPIPLTLVGIVPGHWLFGAEFTATSMIGFIALAGIIVRNSILLVDFTKHEVLAGRPVTESVLLACKARTRPILVTAFALVGGAGVIIFDPIFKGMAISLAFGVIVSTILTLVVIPLGCISVRESFAPLERDQNGEKLKGKLPYDPILEGDADHFEAEKVDVKDEDDSSKSLFDYLILSINTVWLAMVLFVQWLGCLMLDIFGIFTGFFAYLVKKLGLSSSDDGISKEVHSSNTESKSSSEKAAEKITEEVDIELKVELKEENNIKEVSANPELDSTNISNKEAKVEDKPIQENDALAVKVELDKADVKKVTSEKVAEEGVIKKAVPKTSTPKTADSKKTVTKKVTTKKAAIKKSVTKKAASKKAASKKAVTKKAASKKAAADKKPTRRGIRLKSDLDDE